VYDTQTMTENQILLYKALLEMYNSLDNWEEIVLEPQEQIVLPRNRIAELPRAVISEHESDDEYVQVHP
jgi:hypothetical protein